MRQRMATRVDASGASALLGRNFLDVPSALWALVMGGWGLAATLFSSWDPVHIGVAAALTGVTLCCGHSVGLHRFVIHGSGRVPLWLERGLIVLATAAGMGGPLTLMRHHALRDWAQQQPESHIWLGHGRPFFIDVPMQVCCRLKLERPPKIEVIPRFAHDGVYQALDAGWPLIQVPIGLAAWALGGWEAAAWIVGMRVFVSVVMHQVVGWFAHNVGYQHAAVEAASVQGYNLPILGFLSFGEGWHNNHHLNSWSARLGVRRGEWDPGWWFIVGLRALGLAKDVRDVLDEGAQPSQSPYSA